MSTLSRADSSQMAEERIIEEQQKGRSSKKTKKKKKGIWGVECNSDVFFCSCGLVEQKFKISPVNIYVCGKNFLKLMKTESKAF